MAELVTVVTGIAVVMLIPSLLGYAFVLYKEHEFKKKAVLKARRDEQTAKLRAELNALR